jgi:hypothetical protein
VSAECPAGVLLDFADVELVDAIVLGLLDAARAKLEESGTVVRIVVSGQPLRLLRLTGLDETMVTLTCRPPWERHQPVAPSYLRSVGVRSADRFSRLPA